MDQDAAAVGLLEAKVTSMAVLGLVSLAVGMLPIRLAVWLRWAEPASADPVKAAPVPAQVAEAPGPAGPPGQGQGQGRVMSLLLCAGGGVLLCTTLVQLLPEVRVQLQPLSREMGLPAAELLLAAGFFAMYLVEELVHRHVRHRADKAGGVPGGDTAARGLLVVLGLSVHELLEGLAVGLERSPSRVWILFIAIASHKFVISFCIGVQLVAMGSRPAFVSAYVGTFSMMSALGIGLGMAATLGEGAAAGLTATVLQGLAAGTLLYVVFFEVLEPQRAAGAQAGIRIYQLAAVITGFCTMLAIQFTVEVASGVSAA